MPTALRRAVAALIIALLTVGAVASAAPAQAAANNSEIAYSFFRNKGLTRAQASGLIGNFIVESGGDPINPAAVQYGGGPGRGIAQWEGVRRDALFAYAESRGLHWSNLQLQLDFVWKELRGSESYAYTKLKETSTADAAAVAVRVYYERPSVHADPQRMAWSNYVATRYGGMNAVNTSSFPTVKEGSRNGAVVTLQYALRARGYSVVVDGQFGSGTKSTVLAFQRSRGLVADGVVGPITWEALLPTLKQGATGSAVTALQLELVSSGHKMVVDGSFGSGTHATVLGFQGNHGLYRDGVVGPVSWRALIN